MKRTLRVPAGVLVLLVLAGCMQTGLPPASPAGVYGEVAARGASASVMTPTTLTVSAEASIEQVPDLAVVTLGATARRASAAEAMGAQAAAMNAVFAVIRAEGIADEDIQTSALGLTARYDYGTAAEAGSGAHPEPQVSAYVASNQINLTVRDLSRLGALLDSLVAAGATTLSGVAFGLQDEAGPRDRARRLAVEEAIARAGLYAEAAGLEVSRIISIEEESGPGRGVQPLSRTMAGADPGGVTRIAAGELKVTAAVTVVFELR